MSMSLKELYMEQGFGSVLFYPTDNDLTLSDPLKK